MKLQLDENTLNAYINEAIKQELNEATKVDFDKLDQLVGGPKNPKTNHFLGWNVDKLKKKLSNGTFGKYDGIFNRFRGPKAVIDLLKDLGYDDEQIRTGIKNNVIRVGKLTDTNGFTKYDNRKRQNRRTGNLLTAAGMDVVGDISNGQGAGTKTNGQDTSVEESNWPWDSITQEEIDAAKRAQRAARQAAATRKAEQQQAAAQATPQAATQTAQQQTVTQTQEQPTTQPEAQPQQTRKNVTAVDFKPSKPINAPGTEPTFATNVIRAMRQQAKSGNMALVNRIAQNAINTLQKNGGQQNGNAIALIKNELNGLTQNGQ